MARAGTQCADGGQAGAPDHHFGVIGGTEKAGRRECCQAGAVCYQAADGAGGCVVEYRHRDQAGAILQHAGEGCAIAGVKIRQAGQPGTAKKRAVKVCAGTGVQQWKAQQPAAA